MFVKIKNGNEGHVFVAGAFNGVKEYWKEQEKVVDKSDTSNPSISAINLFNSIKKTIDVSQAIKCNEITMEKDIANNKDTFYIVAKPEKCMTDIFDAIVNTYYDYFSECNWIVNNDGKEIPNKIRVKSIGKEKPLDKVISISKLNNKGDVELFNTHEELHEHFYITLKKKYGVIDTNNQEIFKKECKNFNSLASNDVGWVEVANNYLNNKIEPCGGEVNLPIINGYQWDGNSNIQNTWKPAGNINPKYYDPNSERKYDPTNLVSYLNVNNGTSQGICATKVREAMVNCGADFKGKWPYSACKYASFMEVWGYTKVYEGFTPSTEGYTPMKNDIVVIAGDNNNHIHGHIQVYDDVKRKWYSDFGADTIYCYGDKGRPFIVYRWIENNNTSNT